ncbi:uncharacterized protein LOC121234291 [Juglans microcarpa x Juglans regia]|uniref:uncharacterized protein LOC121234291 n=1 Tax=Juglans microcarpa x Juglans regia TaxID=2249226 RepID=UPI001B7F5D1F|nr:uncharacterized protein LOC121234291 [Juglans microcarpa x Juglans regia]
MVLWEITLATAYFLGLKRTYRLALKIQRKVISPKHSKIRQFLHRRTRAVFNIAVKVHHNIQERDIEVGRNVGNWILRWLDRMKPSAQIRGSSPGEPSDGARSGLSMTKKVNNSNLKPPVGNQTSRKQDSGRQLFTSSRNILPKPFPTISMMVRPPKPAGTMTQYRHFSGMEVLRSDYSRGWSEGGGLRKDIMQWMLQN